MTSWKSQGLLATGQGQTTSFTKFYHEVRNIGIIRCKLNDHDPLLNKSTVVVEDLSQLCHGSI